MLKNDELSAAAEAGRICALAAAGQRDLQGCAIRHPELFPAQPFDATVFGAVSMATAFGAPWCTADELRIANRAALWIFAADWLVDHQARTRTEVDDLLDRCAAVVDAGTGAPDDPLGFFLAEIRDELTRSPAFPRLHPVWRDEFFRMMAAMRREWSWKQDGTARPSIDDYLANAANFGSSFVNVSHWIRLADASTLDHLPELLAAGHVVEQVLRLVNDLATHGRDVSWGDLNALMLGLDRSAVAERIELLTERARELLRPIEGDCPGEVAYLTRQVGFSSGFYRMADFWGEL